MVFQVSMKISADPKRSGTPIVFTRVLRQFRVFNEGVILDAFGSIVAKVAERADSGVLEGVHVLKAMTAIMVIFGVALEALVAEAAADNRDFFLLHNRLVLFANDVRRGVT